MIPPKLLRTVAFSILTLFFAVAMGASAYAQETYYVDTGGNDSNNGKAANLSGGDGPFRTIGQAINTAVDGDIISIEAGFYNENLTIAENLTFRIRANGSFTEVEFNNLTMNGSSKTAAFEQGDNSSNAYKADNVTLTNGTLNVGSSIFNINTGNTVSVTAGTMTGTPVFPTNLNVTYNVSADYTTGPELPSDLGTGELDVTTTGAGTDLTLGADVTVGALDVNNGTGNGVLGGRTITVEGTGTTAIDDDVTANLNVTSTGAISIATAGSVLTGNLTVTPPNNSATPTITLTDGQGSIVGNVTVTQTGTSGVSAIDLGDGVTGSFTVTESGAGEVAAIDLGDGVSGAVSVTENDASGATAIGNISATASATIGSITLTANADGANGNQAKAIGTVTVNGTLGALTIANNAETGSTNNNVSLTGSVTGNISITGGGNAHTLTLNNATTASSSTISTTGNLSLAGNADVTGATSTTVGGNLDLAGTSTLTSTTTTVTGTTGLAAGTTIEGNLNASGNVTLANTNADIEGTVTVNGDNIVVTAGAPEVNAVASNGTVDLGNGLVVKGNVTVSGGTTTFGGVTVEGTMDINAGTATADAAATVNSVDIASGATINFSGQTLTVNKDFVNVNGTVTANATSTLAFASNAQGGTFTPGPNFEVGAVTVNKTGQTITVTDDFAVTASGAAALTVTAGTLALQSNTVSVQADGYVSNSGTITNTSATTGGVAFFANNARLSGQNYSNIVVSMANNADNLDIIANTTFTGRLTITRGNVQLDSGADNAGGGTVADLSPVNAGQTVEINIERSSGIVAEPGGGNDTFNGANKGYNLRYIGTLAGNDDQVGSELTSNVVDVTVATTGTALELPASNVTITGNLTVNSGATLRAEDTGARSVTVQGTLSVAGTFADAGAAQTTTIVLPTNDKSHSVTGAITDAAGDRLAMSITGNNVTVAGSGSYVASKNIIDADITVTGTGASLTGLQELQQDVTLNANAANSATISLIDPNNNATTEPGIIGGALTVDGAGTGTATLTLASEVEVDGAIAVGATGVVNMAGNDIEADANVTLTSGAKVNSTGGYLDATTALTITSNGTSIPNLRSTAAVTLADAAVITSNLDNNAAVNGNVTLSGDAELTAGITGNVTVNGASSTLTMTGNVTLTGAVTVNSTGTVTVASSSSTNRTLTVTGNYTNTAGTLSFGSQSIVLQEDLIYTAGAISGTGTLTLGNGNDGDLVNTNNNKLSLSNVLVNSSFTVGNGANETDELEVTGTITFADDANADVAKTAKAKVTIGDGATIVRKNDGAGFTSDPSFAGSVNLTYEDATAITVDSGNERPSNGSVNNLTVNMTGVDVDMGANLTVNGTLTISNTGNLDEVASALTIADGGTIVLASSGGITGSGAADGNVTADDYSVTYRTTRTTGGELVGSNANVTVDNNASSAITVTAGSAKQLASLTLGAADVWNLGGFALQLPGNFTANSGNSFAGTGSLELNGTAAQTFTVPSAGLTLPDNVNLTINNTAGVTLSGGNLNMGNNSTVTFTKGLLTTGDNALKIDHDNTADQGFSVNSDETSYVVGNVIKDIPGNSSASNRLVFPVGQTLASGKSTYSPAAITFNDPSKISGSADSGIDLIVSHVKIGDPANAIDVLGSNGWPIEDGVRTGVDVTRYPDEFYWTVKTTSSLSPSVEYDMELERRGYSEYTTTGADSDVKDLRIVRRAGGNADNSWNLQGTNTDYQDQNFQEGSGTDVHPTVIVRNVTGALNAGQGSVFTYGLKSNFDASAIAAMNANVGQQKTIDLSTVFSGGTGDYSYTVTSNNTSVATAAESNGTLTIDAVAVGSATVTINATDDLNDTESATASITVNAALTSTNLPDSTVNKDATVELTLSNYFTPGTGDLTYAVTTDDAAVATAAEASGVLTVTAVGAGSATIEVQATDETGASVTEDMVLTVNGTLAATGSVNDATLRDGDTSNQTAETVTVSDVSTLFTGGTNTVITASSSDASVASVSYDSNTDAAVVTAVSSTADAATATITYTATDDFGETATVTHVATVVPAYGDVVVDGVVNTSDAQTILNASIEATTLTATQTSVADVNQDNNVNSFDASVTFRYFLEVSGYTTLPFSSSAKVADAEMTYGDVTTEESMVTIPLNVEGSEIYSVDFTGTFDANSASVEGIELTDLPEDWMVVKSTTEEGKVAFALAGVTPITSREIAKVSLKLDDASNGAEFSAKGFVNTFSYGLDEITVKELPQSFALDQNYPNPFNPVTNVSYQLPAASDVTIELWSVTGQKVMTLVNERKEAGSHTVQLNGANLSSGVYVYRIHAQSAEKTFTFTRKMTLIK